MTWVTVGSVAMRSHGVGNREPKDYDVFTDYAVGAPTGISIGGLKLERFWHPSLSQWFPPGPNRMATVDELYTIKVSHSYWSLRNGSWAKHMYDQEQLRRADATLLQPLHDLLYQIWAERYGAKKVNLNQDREAFFGPGIRRYYEHDSVHQAVAYGCTPMYTWILRPGADVDVDPARLRALSHEDKLALWREETAVLALERTLIPHLMTGHRVTHGRITSAWLQALKTMITSATKGASALWLSTHYSEMRQPDDYYERFLSNQGDLVPMGE
jgi:hypothetical protein